MRQSSAFFFFFFQRCCRVLAPPSSPGATHARAAHRAAGNYSCAFVHLSGLAGNEIAQAHAQAHTIHAHELRVGLGAAYCAFGLVLCFYGRPLVKPAIFLVGFVLAGFLGMASAGVVMNALHPSPATKCNAYTVVTIVCGLIGGVISLCMLKIAVFALGALSGSVLGYGSYLLYFHVYVLGTVAGRDGMFWICTVGAGLVVGLIALKTEKQLVVIATALLGAVLAVSGADDAVMALRHQPGQLSRRPARSG